ncbi:MAG: hypothetical protein EOO11_11635 [Chitinophagaceae bacterium]|nr:MAG: hypothetical protein EOO11_11635 [Chitinophagaceae bacterium]
MLSVTYGFLVAFVVWIDRPLTGSPAPDPALWTFRRYIGLYLLGAVFIYTFLTGLNIYRQAQAKVAQAEEVRREFLQMRLQALRNQVSPHFLFNSLSVLSSLVQTDAALAVRFVRQLTKVYRYILDRQELELVTLQQELAFLDAYFFLLQIRFGKKISLQQHLEVDTGSWMLPPLTLQLLVENAVKHNRMSAAQPLRITLHAAPGRVVLANNRSQRDEAGHSTGIGLRNIRGRYALLTRTPVVVDAGSDTFAVTVPLIIPEP